MSRSSIVLLFIKAPVRGQVKSRLAAAIGEEIALELYKRSILDVVETVKASGHPFRICFSPPDAGEAVMQLLGQGYSAMAQRGDDLGARMETAFRGIFTEGMESAVLIGSDLPDLPASIIQHTFDALISNDAVIGPATDGGYYLIGFTRDAFCPGIFHGIQWSTGRVFEETMKRFRESTLRVSVLPEWSDVDTVDDLRALLLRNKDNRQKRSKTMEFLREQMNRLKI